MIAGSIIGIALFSMAMAAVATMMHSYAQTVHVNHVTRQAAVQLAQFNSAATLYFTQTSSPSPGDTVTVDTLVRSGQLPSSFKAKSILGQRLAAMYGGANRVISYYQNTIPAADATRLGYNANSNLAERSVEGQIALYAADYTAGQGNIATGWTITGTKDAQLPMDTGSIDVTKSVSNWPDAGYPSAVLMDNFKGLSYGDTAGASGNGSGSKSSNCPQSSNGSVSTISIKYTSPGAYNYTVPQCGHNLTVTVTAKGAIGGGQRKISNYSGYMVGSFSVPSGSTLKVIVGGKGASGHWMNTRYFGGYYGVGGGGGLSGVLLNGTPEIIAFGGGGGGERYWRYSCGPGYKHDPGGKGFGGGGEYSRNRFAASGTPFGAGGKGGEANGGFGGGGAASTNCGGGGGGYPGGHGGAGTYGAAGGDGSSYHAPNVNISKDTRKYTNVSGHRRPITYSGASPNGYVDLNIQ